MIGGTFWVLYGHNKGLPGPGDKGPGGGFDWPAFLLFLVMILAALLASGVFLALTR